MPILPFKLTNIYLFVCLFVHSFITEGKHITLLRSIQVSSPNVLHTEMGGWLSPAVGDHLGCICERLKDNTRQKEYARPCQYQTKVCLVVFMSWGLGDGLVQQEKEVFGKCED